MNSGKEVGRSYADARLRCSELLERGKGWRTGGELHRGSSVYTVEGTAGGDLEVLTPAMA